MTNYDTTVVDLAFGYDTTLEVVYSHIILIRGSRIRLSAVCTVEGTCQYLRV